MTVLRSSTLTRCLSSPRTFFSRNRLAPFSSSFPWRDSNDATTSVARRCMAPVSSGSLSRDEVINGDPANNITDSIFKKIGINLHQQPGHPICTIKEAIHSYFKQLKFNTFDDLLPVVTTKANFDDLLIPSDHVSRSSNDTYYVTSETVLRCHTSAHQSEFLQQRENAFLVTGDVYRRDAIDATHYPVFHQTEGVKLFSKMELVNNGMEPIEFVEKELKSTLEGLAQHLFGDVECRWEGDYFPFTEPSFELQILFKGEWMEVLGCGVMQQKIVDDFYGPGYIGWAFGLGLERLAMVLFDIPDIRLFWSLDSRFKNQFQQGDLTSRFKPFSKYPPIYRDIAFWLSDKFSENNFCEIVREIAGDLCEEVNIIDDFVHPKTGRQSHCYRITYRSNERSLVDEEINEIQFKIRDLIATKLMVEMR